MIVGEPLAVHTRLPWRLERFDGVLHDWIADTEGRYIVMMCRRDTQEEADANARLIVAAPVLLRVVQAAAGVLQDGDLAKHRAMLTRLCRESMHLAIDGVQ